MFRICFTRRVFFDMFKRKKTFMEKLGDGVTSLAKFNRGG